MATVLAVACIVAMTSVTAFAAITGVTTTTTYDWNKSADAEATVTVTSVVTAEPDDVTDGKQVTYLVSSDDEEGNRTINFIDQKGLDEEGNAEFKFTAKQSEIYNGEVAAQFGTDTGVAEALGDKLPAFKFAEGLDYFTNGTASVAAIKAPTDLTEDFAPQGAICIWGQISGNCDYGYGAYIEYGDNLYELPAYGTTNEGQFCVAITGDVSGAKSFGVYADADEEAVQLAE